MSTSKKYYYAEQSPRGFANEINTYHTADDYIVTTPGGFRAPKGFVRIESL